MEAERCVWEMTALQESDRTMDLFFLVFSISAILLGVLEIIFHKGIGKFHFRIWETRFRELELNIWISKNKYLSRFYLQSETGFMNWWLCAGIITVVIGILLLVLLLTVFKTDPSQSVFQ
ncbi:MAG: hypothetical protein JW854_02640 [Actinobacteria bacterium]|nr:hypothetical protein [Actinomycetota bacterium]